ncbi:MAG: DNA-binding transcriptional LysR family regulator [Acidimicrobiales bacterium]|jgi:DNA-binding transcriptional LysR family regulator
MTPTQLRSFATVVRLGSVRAAAVELDVSEAAVSGSVGSLRKELDDRLFHPSHSGLVFTPGGIRLAQRAVEMLGLQEQTRREVSDARDGRRHLRVVATSLFTEYAAPGLIELFSTRADDLEVELVVDSSDRFDELLLSHTADVVIGPVSNNAVPEGLTATEFLRYGVVGVCTPDIASRDLSRVQWHLGPSAVEPAGVSKTIIERMRVAEDNQRIYTSHAAALAQARDGHGVALVPKFVADRSTANGELVLVDNRRCAATGTWTARSWRGDRASSAARELMRFVTTPRAIQAMLSGSGSRIGRFKPRVHITLWS